MDEYAWQRELEEAERVLARLDFIRDCAEHGGRKAAERLLAEKPDDPDAFEYWVVSVPRSK